MLRKKSPNADNDQIVADIGESAQNIVVGKNIRVIQIGLIQVPRYIAFILLFGTVVVIGVAVRLVYQFWPETVMPEGTFNIAVAELNATNADGKPLKHPEAYERAMSIANFVGEQSDDLTRIFNDKVVVWGPDHNIAPISANDEAAEASALNANVLIYGDLRQIEDNRWRLQPRFYLDDKAIHQAEELAGEHALGSKLEYAPDKVSDRGKVNAALRMRMEALSKLLYGLSLMTDYNRDGYQEAATIFQDVADDSEWAKSKDKSGQEILYLFLGNAKLSVASLSEGVERKNLLVQSRDAFSMAISLNATYARAFNGLGFALIQIVADAEDLCSQQHLLDQAKDHFTAAINLSDDLKPRAGQVDYRANWGLGRIAFFKGYEALLGLECGDSLAFDEAKIHYDHVIDQYEALPDPLTDLVDMAVSAYGELGVIAFLQGGGAGSPEEAHKLQSDAIGSFENALTQSRKSDSQEIQTFIRQMFPLYLTALCSSPLRAEANQVLEDYVKTSSTQEETRTAILSAIDSDMWKECTDVNK